MTLLTSVGPEDDWEDLILLACHDRATAEGEDDASQYQQFAVRYLDLPLRAATRHGHTLERDLGAPAGVRRWQCIVCGAVAAARGTRLSGPALRVDCDLPAKEAAARIAARAAGYLPIGVPE